MNNKLKLLAHADDDILNIISEKYCDISDKEKGRMFLMSERKLRKMKSEKTDVNNSFNKSSEVNFEIVEVAKRGKSYKLFRAAAACVTAIAVVVGFSIFNRKNDVESVAGTLPETTPLSSDNAAVQSEAKYDGSFGTAADNEQETEPTENAAES